MNARDTTLRPFTYRASDAELDDLRGVFSDAPAREGDDERSVAGRAAGDSGKAHALLGDAVRLAQGRSQVELLPELITEIDGLDIRFHPRHVEAADALPLLITHGWPDPCFTT